MPSRLASAFRIVLLGAALGSQGCASLRSVSMTRVPADRSRPIEAESWTWGIFGIYFTNSFVDEAVEDLRGKCKTGRISGVYTKYTGRFFFLWTTRTVSVSAYCEAPQAHAVAR